MIKINLNFNDSNNYDPHDSNIYGADATVRDSNNYKAEANEFHNNLWHYDDNAADPSQQLSQMVKLLTLFSDVYKSINLPAQELPSKTDAKLFYDDLHIHATRHNFPLITINKLADNGSCIPLNHKFHRVALERIGNTLFQRICKMIPASNTAMQDITKLYGHNSDGYGLLYSIIRQTLSWMGTNRGSWCKSK